MPSAFIHQFLPLTAPKKLHLFCTKNGGRVQKPVALSVQIEERPAQSAFFHPAVR
jgi:hypothetical protein